MCSTLQFVQWLNSTWICMVPHWIQNAYKFFLLWLFRKIFGTHVGCFTEETFQCFYELKSENTVAYFFQMSFKYWNFLILICILSVQCRNGKPKKSKYRYLVQLILILWQKVRQTRIFAIVRVFPYYEEAKNGKKWTFFRKWRQLWSWKEFYSWIWPKSLRQCLIDV